MRENLRRFRAALPSPAVAAEAEAPRQHTVFALSNREDTPAHMTADEAEVRVVDAFLSAAECDTLVAAAEAAGFMDPQDVSKLAFPAYYVRNPLIKNRAQIMLIDEEQLAAALWQRVQALVPPTMTLACRCCGPQVRRGRRKEKKGKKKEKKRKEKKRMSECDVLCVCVCV